MHARRGIEASLRPLAVGFAIALAIAACGGGSGGDDEAIDAGVDAASELAAVFPSNGRPGRSLEVLVVVDRATVDADTTFDFGAGITVVAAAPVSPVAAMVQLAIAPDAALGPRDVTITGHGATVIGAGAFGVLAHLEVEVVGGALVQGGMVEVAIRNLDQSSIYPPFLFAGGVWIDQAAGPPSADWRGTLLVDPLAPSTTSLGIVTTDARHEPLAHFISDPLTIAAATPTTVTVGPTVTTTTGTLDAPYATGFFRLTAATAGFIRLSVVATGNAIDPVVAVVPASGTFQDLIVSEAPGRRAAVPIAAGGDVYVIIRDRAHGGGAAAAYGYQLVADLHAPATSAEQAAPHDTVDTAQQVGDLGAAVDGELTASDTADVYILVSPSPEWFVLHTDADLELAIGPTQAQVSATARPFARYAHHRGTASSLARPWIVTVRPRPGAVARPTGTYRLYSANNTPDGI